MKLISHRGNIYGKNEKFENAPGYIDRAINDDYDVEIDVWIKNGTPYLGHDEPIYPVDFRWLMYRSNKLWIHCKNTEALSIFRAISHDFNYFWHENDTATLTSKNYIWGYPGKQPIYDSIAVLPEINNEEISQCIGVCSDKIVEYKNK